MNFPYEQQIITIVRLLSQGHYTEIQKLTKGVRLSAADMERAINDYGRQLIFLKDYSCDNMDIISYDDPACDGYSIVCELFTVEEGRSDLSLEVSVEVDEDGAVVISVDDLHVR